MMNDQQRFDDTLMCGRHRAPQCLLCIILSPYCRVFPTPLRYPLELRPDLSHWLPSCIIADVSFLPSHFTISYGLGLL